MRNPYSAPSADLTQPPGADNTGHTLVFALHGRIGRLRYLAYLQGLLCTAIVLTRLLLAADRTTTTDIVGTVLGYIPLLALSFIVAKRRFNDMNRSGWLSLLLLVAPVTLFAFLSLIFSRGDADANDYGPPPAVNSPGVVLGTLLLPALVVAGILLGDFQAAITGRFP